MDGLHPTKSAAADAVLARARSVVATLKANQARIEAGRELTPEVVEALHGARLFRILLPRSLGGDALDLPTLSKVTEIIAAADASAGWCIGQGGGCAMSAAYLAPEVAKRFFGPRNAVLAWGAGIAGTAVIVPGGYRVSGRWSFASGSRHATMLGAHSKVVDASGKPRLRPDGRPDDRTALFTRAKATIHDVWQVVGLKGTGSDTYEVKDLFVPEEETIDRDRESKERSGAIDADTLYRFSSTMAYASAFAGVMLGITRGALDDVRTLAMTKTPRGASSSLRESQVFQTGLARYEARFRAARALLHATLSEVWGAVDGGAPLTLQQRIDVRLATTHAINEGVDIVAHVYREAGQSAVFEENPFEQRLRDAHSASQQVQGRPSHYMTVGRHMLDLPPDTMMFL